MWSASRNTPLLARPQNPFSSVAIDIVHLPAYEVRKGYTVDYCFVIVDRATGYDIAIPATLKGLDTRKLADPFLVKYGEIPGDNAKYFKNKCISTLCNLAGISTHESVIYDHKTHGGAERAMKSVVKTLRVYLQETNTPTNQWY